MTDTTISTSSTTAVSLKTTDRLFVTGTGQLKPSGTAVTWNYATPSATGITIDNSGIIAPTGSNRAIDSGASAAISATSLTLINHSGASITSGKTALRVQASISGGDINVDNSGSMQATADRAFNIQEYVGLAHFNVTNNAGGTLQSTDDAIRLTTAGAAASGLSSSSNNIFSGIINIDNSGTIKTVGSGSGQALDFNDINATSAGHVTITNHAGGVIEAADADAIRGSRFADIENYGTIQAKNASSSSTGNDAIDFQVQDGGVVNNYQGGQIIGARHGITGTQTIAIANDGTITGQLGSGINLDTASSTTTSVTNTVHGVISGTASGTSDGDGIDIDGLVTISNSGTIQALGTWSGGLSEAITVGGGSITNEAGGLITSAQRAITVDDSNLGNAFAATTIINHGTITGNSGEAISITDTFGDTITNDGTINGSISTDGGNDTLTNSGAINGAVNLGTGNDVANWNSLVHGSVDGNAGTDTINFNGSFDSNLGSVSVTGFESVSGTLAGTTGDDTLNLSGQIWTGTLTINGGDGNDTLSGGAEADTINGEIGNDAIRGSGGDDAIDGGAGSDTAIFSGTLDSYSITRIGATYTVTSADGTDTINNVESFQFNNGTFASDQLGNAAPSLTGAQALLAHGTEDVGFTVSATQLLTGFTDANGDTLAVAGVTASNGSVTDNLDGTYTVSPTADFNGSVTLSYSVADGLGGSTPASLGYSVDAVNDAPALTGAQAVLRNGTEDVGYTVAAAQLLTGFTDVDGDTLAIANLTASDGSVVNNGDGTYTITPGANFNGDVSLDYDVLDGHGGVVSATLGYTLDAVNDAPAGTVEISGTAAAGQSLTASNNLSDPDGLGQVTYHWLRDGTMISGATNDSYVQISDDVGHLISVSASYTDGGGTLESVTSAATDPVAPGSGTYTGTTGNDLIPGSAYDDTLIGLAGNDTLNALDGNDLLNGGDGNDVLNGGAGIDTATYADALKAVKVDLGLATLQNTAGAGSDILSSIENLIGSNFADVLKGNDFANHISGGAGADKLYGFGDADMLLGGDAADQLWGGEGADSLDGGAGADKLFGEAGSDILLGGDGADSLDGGTGADTMTGGLGNDKYWVDDGGDHVVEDSSLGGVDWVYSSINYTLDPNVEKLTLLDGFGNLDGTGNALNNTIFGNDGDNVLNGGSGHDVLTGGLGADTFVFDVLTTSALHDAINDFVSGTDKIELSVSAFSGLAGYGLGMLDDGELTFGTKATAANQHLIYNAISGALFYDADGAGGAAQIQIAVLAAHPPLTAHDITLIG